MKANNHIIKIVLMLLLLAVIIGCTHAPEQRSPDVYVPSISTLKPEEYKREIEKYNKIIQSNHNLRIQQHAHLYLASLYFSPMNPNRDYEPALKHLEDYAIYDPDFVNAVDPRLLMAALIEIEKISALAEAQTSEIQTLNQELETLKRQALASRGNHQVIQKENLRLKKRISRLGKKIRKLETSNAQLNKTIEMLSKLDSRLEEKRSSFTNIDSTAEE